MAKAGQSLPPAHAGGNGGFGTIGGGDFIKQGRHPRRLAAMTGPLQGRQPGHDRAIGRGPGGCDAAHGEGGGIQFVIGAQDQGGADQLARRRFAGPLSA